jgi:hypothetical protein
MTSSTLRLLADSRLPQPMMAYVGCFVLIGSKGMQFGGGSVGGRFVYTIEAVDSTGAPAGVECTITVAAP